jgi:predicted transcriptional regulator
MYYAKFQALCRSVQFVSAHAYTSTIISNLYSLDSAEGNIYTNLKKENFIILSSASFILGYGVRQLMKHRNRLEIIALILQNASEESGASQKKIMYRSFLSYHHLKDYLTLLLMNGLIEFLNNQRKYKITPKGRKFLQIYNCLNEVVEITNTITAR